MKIFTLVILGIVILSTFIRFGAWLIALILLITNKDINIKEVTGHGPIWYCFSGLENVLTLIAVIWAFLYII